MCRKIDFKLIKRTKRGQIGAGESSIVQQKISGCTRKSNPSVVNHLSSKVFQPELKNSNKLVTYSTASSLGISWTTTSKIAVKLAL